MDTGPTTLFHKKCLVTETATKKNTSGCDGFPESSFEARMNDSGESRKEATAGRVEALSTKTKTKIGFWNARTMYEAGKLVQVTAEMRCYNLHILGVSESRWVRSGR